MISDNSWKGRLGFGRKIENMFYFPILILVLSAGTFLTIRLMSQPRVLVTGTWELITEGLPAPLSWEVRIIQKEEMVSLEATSASGEKTTGYGEVKGSAVYFNLGLKTFAPSVLEFQGKAAWATMKGIVSLGKIFSGTWKAERKIGGGAYGHNSGQDCLGCHGNFLLAGTVFRDAGDTEPLPGVPIILTSPEGQQTYLETSNSAGNFWANSLDPGRYLIKVGDYESRKWHHLPNQGSCNRCHLKGGNGTATRNKLLPATHTQVPFDNDCRHCHHYPATETYDELRTAGVLVATGGSAGEPGPRVEIKGKVFPFDPGGQNIISVRPDIFSLGYISMFDAILAVASRHGQKIDYHFDPDC